MAKRKQPGDPLVFPASDYNAFCDAAEDYQRRATGNAGVPGGFSGWPTDKIKIKNSSGGDRQRSEVLKIGDPLYDSLSSNEVTKVHPRDFAYDGQQVTELTDKFCILLDWATDGTTVEAQVSGIVGALVDVLDEDHEYCVLKQDAYTLQSAGSGANRIINKPSGTGEKACVVLLYTSAVAEPAKTLYLPLEMLDNYVLPQDLEGTAIGYEWTPHATNLTNIDTGTEYDIVDYFGSIGLPGQKLICEYNATLSKWIPIPFGQNGALIRARTYKPIPANSSVDGSDIWLLAGFQEIVEVVDFPNDQVRFDHAHSDTDIEGTESKPLDIYLSLQNVDGGAELWVVGRACNP